jgi:hypothetical protein
LNSESDAFPKEGESGDVAELWQLCEDANFGGILRKGSLAHEELGFVSALADLVVADLLRFHRSLPS